MVKILKDAVVGCWKRPAPVKFVVPEQFRVWASLWADILSSSCREQPSLYGQTMPSRYFMLGQWVAFHCKAGDWAALESWEHLKLISVGAVCSLSKDVQSSRCLGHDAKHGQRSQRVSRLSKHPDPFESIWSIWSIPCCFDSLPFEFLQVCWGWLCAMSQRLESTACAFSRTGTQKKTSKKTHGKHVGKSWRFSPLVMRHVKDGEWMYEVPTWTIVWCKITSTHVNAAHKIKHLAAILYNMYNAGPQSGLWDLFYGRMLATYHIAKEHIDFLSEILWVTLWLLLRCLMTTFPCLSRILRTCCFHGNGCSLRCSFQSPGMDGHCTARAEVERSARKFEMKLCHHEVLSSPLRIGQLWSKKGTELGLWRIQPQGQLDTADTADTADSQVRQSPWVLWSSCKLSGRRHPGGVEEWDRVRREGPSRRSTVGPLRSHEDVLGVTSGRISVGDFPVWARFWVTCIISWCLKPQIYCIDLYRHSSIYHHL